MLLVFSSKLKIDIKKLIFFLLIHWILAIMKMDFGILLIEAHDYVWHSKSKWIKFIKDYAEIYGDKKLVNFLSES